MAADETRSMRDWVVNDAIFVVRFSAPNKHEALRGICARMFPEDAKLQAEALKRLKIREEIGSTGHGGGFARDRP